MFGDMGSQNWVPPKNTWLILNINTLYVNNNEDINNNYHG